MDSSNKQIARNTVMLYLRMVLVMIVNLYMSRVVLQILGVEDFGIYSVVGSFVAVLGVLNTAMTSASQRFLSYAEGTGDIPFIVSTFNSVVKVQFSIAAIIFVLGEVLGPIYVYNYLNVASNRVNDAFWVFQFSLLTFVLNAGAIPFTATIIAHEKMDIYAWISILEVLVKLGLVFCLKLLSCNQLVLYSAFLFISALIIQFCYFCYSKKAFKSCKIQLRLANKETTKDILRYSGWNLFGSFSGVAIDQGVNLILNSFFGVAINAARGIAFQVSGAMSQLYGNFQQALSPQIVKSYASDDYDRLHYLIIQGTKLSYYLMFIFAAPILFNIDGVLKLWLGAVPEYTKTFCVLVIINSLLGSLSQTILSGAMATGNIKKYQIVVSCINFLNFPLSIIALKVLPDPFLTAYIMIVLTIVAFFSRLIILHQLINISMNQFFIRAVLPIMMVSIIVFVFLTIRIHLISNQDASLLLLFIMDFVIAGIAVFFLGVTRSEREKVAKFVIRKKKR